MAAQSNWPVLSGTPVIQRRVSIARPPSPPTEPSDVLVLNSSSTSPDSSAIRSKVLYLDRRPSLPGTNPGGLDRTFAGLREIIPREEEEEDAVRYRWIHTIDTHGNGEPHEGTTVRVIDEHREEMEVETGLGLNPETGEIGSNTEVWKCIQLVEFPRELCSVLKSSFPFISSKKASLGEWHSRFSRRTQTLTDPPDSWWSLGRV